MKNQLRICTWNIHFGHELPLILKIIKKSKDFQNIDLLALQETSIHNGIDDALTIAQILGKEYDYFQVNAHLFKKIPQANALIWNTKRIMVTKKESFFLPKVYQGNISRLEKTFFLFVPKQQRNSLVIEGKFSKKTIRIYVSHLDVFGFAHKRAQLATVFLDEKIREEVDMTFIAGDFNTFKFYKRPTWQSLADDTALYGFKDITSDIIWTFFHPKLRMRQKLDAIFIKPQNLSYTSWSLDIPGSDHIPVFANINLP